MGDTHKYWTDPRAAIAAATLPIPGAQALDLRQREALAWYVDLCEARGYCFDEQSRRACASRWLAGKRKVSAPFTKTRKRAAAAHRKAMRNVPQALLGYITLAIASPQARLYQAGNLKAINAVIGSVLKQHPYNPAVVRAIIQEKLGVTKDA